MTSQVVVAQVLLFFIILLLRSLACWARLDAAVILPHGDFAYDPLLVDVPVERRAATRIAAASRRVGHLFLHEHVDPEVIFLITPHGIALSHDFGVYLGEKAWGYADIGADLHRPNSTQYRVSLPDPIALAPVLAQDLLDYIIEESSTGRNMNVTGIKTSADESQNMPLQWAEVIPLLLVLDDDNKNIGTTTTQTATIPSAPVQRQHIIWSQPLRRFGEYEGADMVKELLRLGQTLFDWMEQRPERMAVLVSADLSHTHRKDGPYGYSATSQPFDDFIGKWAHKDPCRNAKVLLEQATTLQPTALSCGYTGMVMLHGMLCGEDRRQLDRCWVSKVLVDKNVTYYGMMAAMIKRVDKVKAE